MFRAAVVVLVGAAAACAHEPITTKLTWSREISRIVFKRCVSCHRPGGVAPMSLLTYDEARPWAVAIKEEISERRMPPWGAVKGFGDFAADQGLSQDEISRLADWVEGGAPPGEEKYLPPPPKFEETATPKAPGAALTLRGSLHLDRDLTLVAIRPRDVKEGASIQVTARLADGSVEPLLWLRDYKARWQRTYTYRAPLRLPRGTVLEATGAPAAALTLYTRSSKSGTGESPD